MMTWINQIQTANALLTLVGMELEKLERKIYTELFKNSKIETQATYDHIRFTKEQKDIMGSENDEICIFCFDIEICTSFMKYFDEELLSQKNKFLLNDEFNIFGFDIERNLKHNKNQLINSLDSDKDGFVDLNDHNTLVKILQGNQNKIIEIDKTHIQKFVKISTYLKTKRENIQKIFEQIELTKNENELEEQCNLLKNQIHTYDSLFFHSLSMISSLIDEDLITFYEIFETFDKLGIFNSNWENEISEKLIDISDGINEIIYMIDKMEKNIVNSINNLTYITQNSFSKLNSSVDTQLKNVDSLLRFNNLLTGIQTYQIYKINKTLKD